MRIVAGTLRGRPLFAPEGAATRPTADRTRQALFNVLEHAPWAVGLAGRRAIDLFAGSGALGMEALSRGASHCLFLDSDRAAAAVIQSNAERLGLMARARIERWDALRLPARMARDGAAFDLAFLDPPYGRDLAPAALAGLGEGDWLAPEAVAVVERGGEEGPISPAGYTLLAERVWGAAKIAFLRRTAAR
jgi:16S rRNA (guanine966-N2)-methyltransferase